MRSCGSLCHVAFKIHTTLGPRIAGVVYESAFFYELTKRGLKVAWRSNSTRWGPLLCGLVALHETFLPFSAKAGLADQLVRGSRHFRNIPKTSRRQADVAAAGLALCRQ
ncbi:MAG: hypothetical protein DMG06_09555 [Acidobacteria bacterium]|nr:MAG: hypothetical protein DMG06_09555 [Acidobacteriota bacterium]